MKGTVNTGGGFIYGNQLSPPTVNDLIAIATSADDLAAFPLVGVMPPSGASSTNVNTAYQPIVPGPLVIPGSGRQVLVQPVKLYRSSRAVATPCSDMTSVVVETQQAVSMSTVAGSGLWGFDLLYAKLSLVSATYERMGFTVSFGWATPTYVATASSANYGTLPANTATDIYIPLRYVRNYAGQSSVVAADIIDVPPNVVSGFAGNLQARVNRASGVDFRKAYSSAANAPTALPASGGTTGYLSWAGTNATVDANRITVSQTPRVACAQDVEYVSRFIYLPPNLTGGTNNLPVSFVVDNTRDWRNGQFRADWVQVASGTEMNSLIGGYSNVNGSATPVNRSFAQSFAASTIGSGVTATSRLWVAFAQVASSSTIQLGLYADPSTGALTFINVNSASLADGKATHVFLDGWFFN